MEQNIHAFIKNFQIFLREKRLTEDKCLYMKYEDFRYVTDPTK